MRAGKIVSVYALSAGTVEYVDWTSEPFQPSGDP